ncbi:MAG: hypothetical protein ACKVTZ_02930 [Bacteroidia bacterium]
MITELTLESFQNDFEQVKAHLQAISKQIIAENISDYPIFIASHQWLEIGKPIFSRDDMHLNWYFFVSILEEFQKRKLIPNEGLAALKEKLEDSENKACIFLVAENDARFVFVRY